MRPLGLYVHWPFCRSKCPYCDFNSHVSTHVDYAAFGDAMCKEMTHMASLGEIKKPLSSIFFGGGTPSLMPPALVNRIIAQAHDLFGFTADIEITAEANPTSVEASALAGFKDAGINRISMGVQALDAASLSFLGREHSASEALNALEVARNLFRRVSIDLIYGLPDQSLSEWQNTLSELCGFGLDHLSLYQLTIEPGTVFYTRARRGEILTAPDDAAADMFDMTHDVATSYGLPAYEISNFARVGEECRHNLIYWRAQDWLGIGPGAHGRISNGDQRIAIATRRSPQGWLDAVTIEGHGVETQNEDNSEDQITEILMMGLRLCEGVNIDIMEQRFGARAYWLNNERLSALLDQNLLTLTKTDDGTRLMTTVSGRRFLNYILAKILV